jgi:hypothetical protein
MLASRAHFVAPADSVPARTGDGCRSGRPIRNQPNDPTQSRSPCRVPHSIAGLNTWNEFLISTTFLQARTAQTAVVRFYMLGGQYSSDWGEIMAAALIIVAPMVVFFLLMQRRFIEGMASGSVKG